MTSTPRSKSTTRRALLACRDGLGAEVRASASARIAERALGLLDGLVAPGSVVAIYAAKGSEVDTAAIDRGLRERGLRAAYPRVNDPDRALTFHAVGLDELVPTRWGLREPAGAPAVELASIAAFLLPGLAFDRAGGRIGWGKGHYDATLGAAPHAVRAGLAFDCQVVDEVPHEPHDQRLHFIITEVATYPVA